MSPVLHLLMLVFALVCFLLAAGIPTSPEPYWHRLLAAGLAFLVASMISW